MLSCGAVLRFLIAWLYRAFSHEVTAACWCSKEILCELNSFLHRNRLRFVTMKFALGAGHVRENTLYKNNDHELKPIILDSHGINNSLDTF